MEPDAILVGLLPRGFQVTIETFSLLLIPLSLLLAAAAVVWVGCWVVRKLELITARVDVDRLPKHRPSEDPVRTPEIPHMRARWKK